MYTIESRGKKMLVRDLLKEQIDIDVCDDYDERCWIAFCGPVKLTAKGKRVFASVLKLPIEFHNDIVILKCSDAKEASLLKKLFYGAAGYITQEEYDELFVEVYDE